MQKILPILILLFTGWTADTAASDKPAGSPSCLRNFIETVIWGKDTVCIIRPQIPAEFRSGVIRSTLTVDEPARVEDAAGAVIALVRWMKSAGNTAQRDTVKSFLRFLLKVQASRDLFDTSHRPDYPGRRDSGGAIDGTTALSFRALLAGYRFCRPEDPEFARKLKRAAEKIFPQIRSLLAVYPRIDRIAGYRIPRWLPPHAQAKISSDLIFGLTDYVRGGGDKSVRRMIGLLGEGLKTLQDGDERSYPYGMIRSEGTIWVAEGNYAAEALAAAGKVLGRKDFIRSAEKEVNGWYARLLIGQFPDTVDVTVKPGSGDFERSVGKVLPIVTGCTRLYEATGNEAYLCMAGLAASPLFGNSPSGQKGIDVETGCWLKTTPDSMMSGGRQNISCVLNSLMILADLRNPGEALRYIHYISGKAGSSKGIIYTVFRGGEDEELTLVLDMIRHHVKVFVGRESTAFRSRFGGR